MGILKKQHQRGTFLLMFDLIGFGFFFGLCIVGFGFYIGYATYKNIDSLVNLVFLFLLVAYAIYGFIRMLRRAEMNT